MKPCPECGKKFKNDGLRIHLAKVHGIKTTHDDNLLSVPPTSTPQQQGVPETKPQLDFPQKPKLVCPHPFCKETFESELEREAHWKLDHPEWFRPSDGRFVFEASP